MADPTPWETVLQHYRFPEKIGPRPFVPHPLQIGVINVRAVYPHAGLWMDTGTGKTFVETAIYLYRKILWKLDTLVLIMPPLLIPQWARWLAMISPATSAGKPLKVVQYRGGPKEREKLSLEGADFVLVGFNLFLRDYSRFKDFYEHRTYQVGIDEATMIGGIGGKTHDAVFEFAIGKARDLLSGTPSANPLHVYAMVKFTAPEVYPNYQRFLNHHVETFDAFDMPETFKNLGDLKANLGLNSSRILFKDMYPAQPDPLILPESYELEEAHYKLYCKLAEEQLLVLPDGGKIDATTATRLMHNLGQIVANWHHFAQDPKKISNTILMVDQKLKELQGEKLVVFANYKLTMNALKAYFPRTCAGVINSDASDRQKEAAVQAFIHDDSKTLLAIHPASGGKGVDGLQHVCNRMMIIEPPPYTLFHQMVARLQRGGQTRRVAVHMPIAEGTLQRRRFRALLEQDAVTGQTIRTAFDLREAIYGR